GTPVRATRASDGADHAGRAWTNLFLARAPLGCPVLFLLRLISVLIALLPILPLQGKPPGGTYTSYSDSRQATSKSAQIAQKTILTGGAVRPVLGHGLEIPRYRTTTKCRKPDTP